MSQIRADGGAATTYDTFRGFLRRLGTRCRFAMVLGADEPVAATCLAIASEDRLGIHAMLTSPDARRQGAATALLHGLAELSLREQVRELYLLVETDNTAARALYARCGFEDVYRYHYRVAPAPAQSLV